MKFEEKTVDKKLLYKGKIIELNLHRVKLPNGKESSREIVNHPGGVAILTYKNDDTLIMVEQFRKPLEKTILEIPAGKMEKGEKPEVCGRRELEEETGYKAKTFKYLGKIVTSPGFCDEVIYIYEARDLYKGRNDIADEDEFINLKEIKTDKIKDMIKSGEIIDAKTVSSFMFI
ncbi:ADP-ribose pyrophosphatase [Clostridium algifaecis]|uniref:ADP-ribose pyrophosphatase n=1 Tax=Clostridium algifaecis TaxID=1472040 RepID=A0ABS4KPK1_9CLOT|nr:NUDIX hydrolase [Clostridium algifaecis]MBP2031490.1 ADP-ribose pyrophosphatase [Clostridium algifaecis]